MALFSSAVGRIKPFTFWDVETGKSKEVFEIPVNWALSIALSPDGKMLATGSDRTSVKFWDVATGRCLRHFTQLHQRGLGCGL